MVHCHEHSLKSLRDIIENKSHMKILNKKRPKIEPCRTPKMISCQELYALFIFELTYRIINLTYL